MTRVEAELAPELPTGARRQTLTDMSRDQRPDQDTIAAVITLLTDQDDEMRETAEVLLRVWGTQSVSALLNALRSTDPLDVPYRQAIIRQLARLGPDAARAETLLRSLFEDPNVGDDARQALKEIRRDFDDLIGRFARWGIEIFLLGLVVAAPIVAVRRANPRHDWPPLGMVIGVAALAVAGLMLARYQFAGDLLPDHASESQVSTKRWTLYAYLVVLGAGVGVLLGWLMLATGGTAQKLLGQ